MDCMDIERNGGGVWLREVEVEVEVEMEVEGRGGG